jgi:hypothetical protein
MARGSCLCGGIGFEIDDAAIVLAVACYCTNCRKVSGSQFGIYLQVKRSGFRWLGGEDRVGSYESSPGNRRGFCTTCGAVAPIATSYGAMRVPGGALDDDPGTLPDVVIFSTSRAPWCAADAATRAYADAGPRELWTDVVRRLLGG